MIPIDVSRAWAERAVGVQAWARSIGIESMHAAGGWYPKLPGFDSIEVYGPLPRGVDPATADYTLPPPGDLAFKGPVPFGHGQTLPSQLVAAVRAAYRRGGETWVSTCRSGAPEVISKHN